MATKKLLAETLDQLSPEDFAEFKSVIEVELNLPSVCTIRRLVWFKGERSIFQVEMMKSLIELLLETLADLSDSELSEFKQILIDVCQRKWILYIMADLQDTVFLMVQTYGPQSVEKTMECLTEMKRTDLAQRLSDCSSLPRKKLSVDDGRSALIHKVATMAAVKHLLLGTLNDLSSEEFEEFKRFLRMISPLKDQLYSSWRFDRSDRADVVNLMVDELGQRSVETTRKVFMYMKRTDLIQKLPESSSGSREKRFMDEDEAAVLKSKKTLDADRQILFDTLKDLSQKELIKFSLLLPFTCFQKGLPQIKTDIYMAEELVDEMVDKLGQRSVEATREVLTDMKRNDLVQRLSESSSGSKGQEAKESSGLEGCVSLKQDYTDWTKLEPAVNGTDSDEAPTYSLQSEAGHFECSVSGLRWVCKEKASFQYQFSSWEGHMERMESRRYMPAGPLMDVRGRVQENHFVDKHRVELIQRVSNTGPILDELLQEQVIQQERYDRIRVLPTSQEKIRELYSGPLKAGSASKDVFYKILQRHEKRLVGDLC